MITNPSTITYSYRGGRYHALDLIHLLGFKLSKEQMRTMANRLRYHAHKHGIDKAMEIMSKAKPPASRVKVKPKATIKQVKNRAYAAWKEVQINTN